MEVPYVELLGDLSKDRIDKIIALLKRVYGDWNQLQGKLFPKPLPSNEAGSSMETYPGPEKCQRRYLWTDAFGILTFANLVETNPSVSIEYIDAGKRLIEATRATLGNPRGKEFPMRVDENGKHLGLRIGKVLARPSSSDAGMTFDGMYWHYIDKWIFSLLRFGQAAKIKEYIVEAAQTAKELHPFFFSSAAKNRGVGGYHWKLTSDLKHIPGLPESPSPNDDTISALIVYAAIEAEINRGLFDFRKKIGSLHHISTLHIR